MRPRNDLAYSASLSSTIVAILLISSNLLSVITEVEAKCSRCRDRNFKPPRIDFDTEGDIELSSPPSYLFGERGMSDKSVQGYVRRAMIGSEISDPRTIDTIVTFAKCIIQLIHGRPFDKKCCSFFPFNIDSLCSIWPKPTAPPTSSPLPSVPSPSVTPSMPPPPPPPPSPSTTTKPPSPATSAQPSSNSTSTTTTTTTTSQRPNTTTYIPGPTNNSTLKATKSPDQTSNKAAKKVLLDEQPESTTIDVTGPSDETTSSDSTTLKPSKSKHRARKGKHGKQNQEEKPKEVDDD